MPLAGIFDCRKPGRSRAALARRIDKLAKTDRLDESMRLKSYLNLVVLAESLRAENIPGASAASLSVAVHAMLGEGVHLPSSVQVALVEHRAKVVLASSSDATTFVEVTKPWGGNVPFDPTAPKLACAETSFAKKCELYQNMVWRRFLIPMALGDMNQTEKLDLALGAMLDSIEEEDVLELDMKEAVLMQESKTAAAVLRSLLRLPPTGADMGQYSIVQSRCGKLDHSIMTSVANAIHNNPILKERLELTVKGLPVLAEFGPKMDDYEKKMEVGGYGKDWFIELTAICKDLLVLHSSPASALFLPYSERVKEAIIAAWAAFSSQASAAGGDNADGSTLAGLQAAQCLFAEASAAFSLDDGVAAARAEVGSMLQDVDKKWRHSLLKELLSNPPPEAEFVSEVMSKYMSDMLTKLCDVAGARCEPAEIPKFTEAYDNFFKLAAEGMQADPSETAHVDRIIDILRRLDAMQGVGNRAALLKVVIFGCDLMKVLAEDCDELRNANVGTINDYIVSLSSGYKVLKSSFGDPDVVDCGAKKLIAQSVSKLIATASALEAKYIAGRSTSLLSSLDSAAKNVMDIGGEYLANDKAWHSEVTGDTEKDFHKVCAVADEVYKAVDTKIMESRLASLRKALEECAEVRDLKDNAAVVSSKSLLLKATVLNCELLVTWHISHETDKESLRKKVIAEVKKIRSLGAKEKGCMCKAIFKRANAILLGDAAARKK